MGVVRSQATWQTVVNYLGTAIGTIAVLWIYPLELSVYGLAQFLIGTGQFLIPFVSLGTITIIVKFFPESKEDGWDRGYLLNVLLIISTIVLLISGVVSVFNTEFLELLRKLGFRDDLLFDYGGEVYFIALLALYNSILALHTSNYKRIVVPAVLQNLLPKLTLPPLVLLFHFQKITQDQFIDLWLATFVATTFGLLFYMYKVGALDIEWRVRHLTRGFLKRVGSFAAFTGASSMGGNLITRVDVVLLALLVDFSATGVYFIAVFLARVVRIPVAAVSQISAPIISEAWTKQDVATIDTIYKKASLNLSVAGMFIFTAILVVAEPLFNLSSNPEPMLTAIPLFVFLGLTYLVEMVTSLNHHILIYSRLYRIEFYLVLFTGIINVPITYYLIRNVGVQGAAIATFFAILVLNSLRLLVIYRRLHILPFGKGAERLLLLAAFCTLYSIFTPSIGPPIVDLLFNGTVYSIIFIVMAERLGLLEDFKPIVFQTLDRFRKKG